MYKKVDLTYLNTLSEGNWEIAKEFISIFISQVPGFILQMRSSLAEQNWKDLRVHVHSTKSSLFIVGMNDLAERMKQFEISIINMVNTDKYSDYITHFEVETAEALNELNQILEQKP